MNEQYCVIFVHTNFRKSQLKKKLYWKAKLGEAIEASLPHGCLVICNNAFLNFGLGPNLRCLQTKPVRFYKIITSWLTKCTFVSISQKLFNQNLCLTPFYTYFLLNIFCILDTVMFKCLLNFLCDKNYKQNR